MPDATLKGTLICGTSLMPATSNLRASSEALGPSTCLLPWILEALEHHTASSPHAE